MANFPGIAPTTRVYLPGNTPQVINQSLSGVAVGFRRGSKRVSQQLSMSFEYLSESEMIAIKDHFIDNDGTYGTFFLSQEIWADFVSPPVPLTSNFAWRYASSISIADVSYNRFSVSVELESVPIEMGDLVYDALAASEIPEREYILDGGLASASPARDLIISPVGAA